ARGRFPQRHRSRLRHPRHDPGLSGSPRRPRRPPRLPQSSRGKDLSRASLCPCLIDERPSGRVFMAKRTDMRKHQTAAWLATQRGETIQPGMSFVEDPENMPPLSHEEEERARKAIEVFRAGAAAIAADGVST